MSILNTVKDYIMGRPKNSKNKPKTPEPVEFNYEDETAPAAWAAATNMPATQEFNYTEEMQTAAPVMSVQSQVMAPAATGTYLISGKVSLTRPNAEMIVSDQTRIVYASSFNEAAAKYSNYFTSMSNQVETYTVMSISGSEAIR